MGRNGTGRDGTSIGFLTNYNTRTTPLDYKLLIMPVGGLRLVPIFGGPARNFRCIIYGRFNEPRKRSKGPRGLFLIIRRRQRRAGQAPCLLFVAPLAFPLPPSSSSSRFLFFLVPDTPFSVPFDNILSPDASRVILITRNIIKTWCEREIREKEDEVRKVKLSVIWSGGVIWPKIYRSIVQSTLSTRKFNVKWRNM